MSGGEDFYYKNYFENRRKRRLRSLLGLKNETLLDLESKVGSRIFGQAPSGIRREFFNLNENSWIWHEEWVDGRGQTQNITTRYEIHGDKVLKILPGPKYQEVVGQELSNFYAAVSAYHKAVLSQVYRKYQ